MEQKMKKTRVLVECAILVALAIVLSYIKFDVGAEGGSVSLVMVPLVLIAFRHGTAWGVGTGLVFGFVKCVLGDGLGWGLPSILLDYVLAYGAVGLAGLFRKMKNGVIYGTLVGGAARFFVHFLSGVLLYASYAGPIYGLDFSNETTMGVVLYSIVYNGAFMVLSIILTLVVMILLQKAMPKKEKF